MFTKLTWKRNKMIAKSPKFRFGSKNNCNENIGQLPALIPIQSTGLSKTKASFICSFHTNLKNIETPTRYFL